ncbi:MAG: hypothetical protein KKC37_06465 [Proteobacteria bacterium]|nr:hypothetical protein [Pseudomonadota bacterium]
MAEIKSTLDLVMEKTKGLTLSDEEKEAQERERLDRTVEGLWRRVKAAGWSVEEMNLGLADAEPGEREEIKRRFGDRLAAGLTVGDDLPAQIGLLAEFDWVDAGALADLRRLVEEVTASRSRALARAIEAERHSLAAAGISGSAVVPKVPSERRAAAEADAGDLSARLDELKARLLPGDAGS